MKIREGGKMKDTNFLVQNGVDVAHGIELLGDIQMYNSILQEFLNSYNERMQKIMTYKNALDMENYAIEVHALKSDSKYLGFNTLADLAYQHEMASKSRNIEAVNASFNQLIQEANRIMQVGKTYLGIGSGGQTPTSESTAPKKAILVADDSNIIRAFISDIFQNQYEVLLANDGKEVLDLVNARSNDIVALLLDLNMPNLDGFQVLEYFQYYDLFKKIPVSIISGSDDKETIDRAFTYPIIDMLNKPFDKESVKAFVEKTISIGAVN